jgi:anti-anti-sigma factor
MTLSRRQANKSGRASRARADVSPLGSRALVAVAGDLESYSSRAVGDALAIVIRTDHRDVVVDLSGVTCIDAGGLGAIVRARRVLQTEDRELTIRCPSMAAWQTLQLAGLTHLIETPEGIATTMRR